MGSHGCFAVLKSPWSSCWKHGASHFRTQRDKSGFARVDCSLAMAETLPPLLVEDERCSLAFERRNEYELHRLCACGRIAQLLDILENGSSASRKLYSQMLCKCGQMKAGAEAMRLHAHLADRNLELDGYLGACIVEMYVKCGNTAAAEGLHKRLPEWNELSWTALVLGFASCGQERKAVRTYEKMREIGVKASTYTFVHVLKACIRMGDWDTGRRIHAHATECGCDSDVFVGNTLIDMYAKCGSMVDALQVFDRLHHHDVVAWTTLILGYAEQQDGASALQSYARMHHEGVAPNERTFVGALKACSSLATLEQGSEDDGNLLKIQCLETGRSIHSQIVKGGFESNVFVGTTLLDMYAKCGSMVDACHVFDKLLRRDVVSWDAMILGYAQKEEGEVALQLYERMQLEGVAPDDRTFVGALKACSSLAALEEETDVDGNFVKLQCLRKGKCIHSRIVEGGFEANVYLGTTLMDMYAKCGSMLDARLVFHKLPYRDVVSWTAMISGYAEKQEGELALQFYTWLQHEGVAPNERTYVGALKACSSLATMEEGTEVEGHLLKLGSLEKGRSIHSQVVKHGLESNSFLRSILIDIYAKCGSMVDAQSVFDRLSQPDVVSWNAMISGYVDKRECELALLLYARMQQQGVVPDDRTFVGTLKACGSLAILDEGMEIDGKSMKMCCLEKGRAIHCQVRKRGFESNVFVGNTLVDMYVKCGSIVDARHVFDRLPHRDTVSWNVMISGYAEQEESEEACKLYVQMQEQGLSANIVTFLSTLKACGKTAALETGKQIHAQICRAGLESTDLIVATALIDMYGKCGNMVDAQQVFDVLPRTDVVTWNALIAGYARQGESQIVFHLFEKMRQHEAIQPNGITFLSVLTLCSHVGLVDKAQEYFNAMSKSYGITPSIGHYTCMVDVLGRAGQMDEVVAMMERMTFPPDLVTWTAVLGACRKWNNVDLGRQAFDCAVRVDAKHAAAYVLMSNIYADAHMWEDRSKIQAMMEKEQAWKKPGQSWWTEIGGKVHTFTAGDMKHAQSRAIYAKIEALYVRMKEQGYVPDVDCVLWDLSDVEKEDVLCGHSEKLAIACALINTPAGTPIRIVKNLRVCTDCHKMIALISKIEGRQIICRDASRFHVYDDGKCSCGDYW